LNQTYPNKQLLICSEPEDAETRSVAQAYTNYPQIKHITFPGNSEMNLGQKRNYAIEQADGDIVCTWDDDDWYHRYRLEEQVLAMQKSHKPVCLLSHLLVFNAKSQRCYASSIRLWEQTVMFRKELYYQGYRYDELPRSEDKAFIERMVADNLVYPLFRPQLYIYNFHGGNTWGQNHFDFFMQRSQALDQRASLLAKHTLDGTFNHTEGSNAIESPAVLLQIRYVS